MKKFYAFVIAGLVLFGLGVLVIYFVGPLSGRDTAIIVTNKASHPDQGEDDDSASDDKPPSHEIQENPVESGSVSQFSIVEPEVRPIDYDTFQDRSGSLGTILKELDLRTDVAKAAPTLGLDLNQNAEVSMEGWSSNPIIRIELNDLHQFQFSGLTRELVSYGALWEIDNVPLQLTRDDAIDPASARDIAQVAWNAFGFQEDLSEAECYYSGSDDTQKLRGTSWVIQLEPKVGDFNTDALMRVSVCAYSGDLISLTRVPLVVPENMEIKIDENEALVAASRFAESKGLGIGEPIIGGKWISRPNPTIWDENKEDADGPELLPHRAVYIVYAEDTSKNEAAYMGASEKRYYYFSVDCYSGEVIGGGGRIPIPGKPNHREE